VDLGEPLPDETMREIERALHHHGVVFFRNQNLDVESQIEFGRWFGELHIHHASDRNLADHPEIHVIKDNKKEIAWHADVTFAERPPKASILRPVTLPAVGGDTLWASTCA